MFSLEVKFPVGLFLLEMGCAPRPRRFLVRNSMWTISGEEFPCEPCLYVIIVHFLNVYAVSNFIIMYNTLII